MDPAPGDRVGRWLRGWRAPVVLYLVFAGAYLGASGARPTHPELLEWLSAEFVRGGWRIKPIIRLIMTSTAYRQASWRSEADRAGGERVVRRADGLGGRVPQAPGAGERG